MQKPFSPNPGLHLVGASNGNSEIVPGMHDRLIGKLGTIGSLSESDRDAIRSMKGRVRQLRPYEDVISEGDKPNAVAFLHEGFACRYKIVEDGKRQILSFHIPGDVPDAQSLFLERMDHSLGTLTDVTVVHIEHKVMLDLFAQAPKVAHLFWRGTLIDASIFREWMVGLGRRNAYQRMAHLFCEVITQLHSVGLVDAKKTCELPLTQAEIGDATGLSNVHVSRTLKELREAGLLTFRAGSLAILDWDGLVRAGEFDPDYLHLKQQAAA